MFILNGYLSLADAVRVLHGDREDAIGVSGNRLRAAVASGELIVFGVSRADGELRQLPPEVWRRTFFPNDGPDRGRQADPFMEGVADRPVPLHPPNGLSGWHGFHLPMIAAADLARWQRADVIPAEPPIRPHNWKPREPAPAVQAPPPASDRAAELAAWMRGYLFGVKRAAKGEVAKSADAIADCCSETGCTTREAEAAYQAAPFPDLRNPPPSQRGRAVR